MPASQYVDRLPEIDELRRRCQALAVLDAILCPEWEYRYFSFNSSWSENEMLASMRNGEGDDWQVLFHPAGAVVKGFAHGAPMAEDSPRSGVLDALPQALADGIREFALPQTTFCLWRLHDDDGWKVGDIDYPAGTDPDGSDLLLSFLDGDPLTYCKWGEAYYGTRLNPRAVEHIYRHDPLTPFVVKTLNAEAQLDDARTEIREIGYPV